MQEYVRIDNGYNSEFKHMFDGALDARALLGEQVETGQNISWNETQYVGSPLTDAFIAMALAASDWVEMGQLYLGETHNNSISNLRDWTLGNFTFSGDDNTTHPELGCNNDRMTHAPKGICFGAIQVT